MSTSGGGDDNFEKELSWCIEKLFIDLKAIKPDSKQAVDAVKVLKILQSKKAPLVKKCQAMRIKFGDYRQKMKDEEGSGSSTKNLKFVGKGERSEPPSQYLKKSSKSSTITQTETPECKTTKSDESNSDFHFVRSENDFKFSFPEPQQQEQEVK